MPEVDGQPFRPVVDLSARFGSQRSDITRRTCIVIIEVETDGEKHDIGVVVDSVSAVLEIADAEIEAAPSFGAKIRADFIAGMGKVNGKFVIIIDVNNVLALDDLAVLEHAVGGAPMLAKYTAT